MYDSSIPILRVLPVLAAQGVPLLEGPPGCGKTSAARALAARFGARCFVVCPSHKLDTEIHGQPVISKKPFAYAGLELTVVETAPPRYVMEAVAETTWALIVYDELTTCDARTQAPLLSIFEDRLVGDVGLPRDRIGLIACCNPPGVAAGGMPLTPPAANRLVHLKYRFDPIEFAVALGPYWNAPPTLGIWGIPLPEEEWLQDRSLVSAYLRAFPGQALAVPEDAAQLSGAFPTPRCYDDKTEVLSRDGFVRWADVTKTTELATLDNQGRLDYSRPSKLFRAAYHGKMYRFTAPHLDLMVTPNHSVWAARSYVGGSGSSGQRDRTFQFVAAETLVEELKSRRSFAARFDQLADWVGSADPRGKKIGDRWVDWGHWAEFVGWYVTDGYILRSKDVPTNTVRVTQRKAIGRARILWLLRQMGFNPQEHRDKASITDRAMMLELLPLGRKHRGERYVPRDLMAADRPVLRRLADGLFGGDGWSSNGGVRIGVGVCRRLAADAAEVYLKLGLAATEHTRVTQKGKTVYEVSARTVRYAQPIITSANIHEEDYTGEVFCAEVLHHRLFVRREGKGVWCGNSWDKATRLLTACRLLKVPDGDRLELVAGCVGQGATMQFLAWQARRDWPDPRQLLDKPSAYRPPKDDAAAAFYVLTGCATEAARRKRLAVAPPAGAAKAEKARLVGAANAARLAVGKLLGITLDKKGPKDVVATVGRMLFDPAVWHPSDPIPEEVVRIAPIVAAAGLDWTRKKE